MLSYALEHVAKRNRVLHANIIPHRILMHGQRGHLVVGSVASPACMTACPMDGLCIHRRWEPFVGTLLTVLPAREHETTEDCADRLRRNAGWQSLTVPAAAAGAGAGVASTINPEPCPATQDGSLTVTQRLAAGAGAGMTATALTHPIDTLRLRLALPGSTRQGALVMLSP